MTFPFLRRRVSATPVLSVPGLGSRPFAHGSLADTEAAQVQRMGFYHFHLGDVFTPGAANWALDPSHDTPLNTVWGHGVQRNPFAFQATSPQVVRTNPAAPFDAIRGMIYHGIAPERLNAIPGGANG